MCRRTVGYDGWGHGSSRLDGDVRNQLFNLNLDPEEREVIISETSKYANPS